MEPIQWLCEQHPFLTYQCFSIPFAFLFYVLAKQGCLSLTYRYLFLASGGCILAIITMGVYSLLLLISTVIFVLLVCSLSPERVHPWVFGLQMGWQTFWHLLIQYREYYLNEPTDSRLLLSMSSLMLLTQRVTSVSMDLQDGGRVTLMTQCRVFLPLISYALNFTALLGGPLSSFDQFVYFVEQITISPPPQPLSVISYKGFQVLSLEWARNYLTRLLRDNASSLSVSNNALTDVLWIWGLAVVLRIRYYSHWKISECLNNAAGLGFRGMVREEDSPNWSGLSDGDLWTTEMSCQVSEFARRWNGTTATWLRRLVFQRCKTAPLVMTFGFSIWWHGIHLGQFVGFLVWAAAVRADYQIYKYLKPKLTSTRRRLVRTCLCWLNTQMVMACVVIAIELRSTSSLKILGLTYTGVFPLLNVLFIFIV
ncbi:ghrelin O-acyltransferase [Oncorhynchus masou masou]|uniref:ghrelin O-acyltransferase n=1 Tax=Oncorhynchus masou masou TaxID=90313 RepID=UPI0031830172